jgi:Fe-S oxidoreductase
MPWWARLAEPAPWLANLLVGAPPLAGVAKKAAGVAPERDLPGFAPERFTRWFARRNRAAAPGAAPVLLWPDTFSNYLAPEPAKAAVEVLEAAGRRVELPRARLCCGRPLYDFGMLRLAKRTLRRVLDELSPHIEEGIPVVGLEPACVSVFRDEMLNLFPADEHARRLAGQTFTLAEFLEREGFEPPRLERRALVHRHCHAQAIMGFEPDLALTGRSPMHLAEVVRLALRQDHH